MSGHLGNGLLCASATWATWATWAAVRIRSVIVIGCISLSVSTEALPAQSVFFEDTTVASGAQFFHKPNGLAIPGFQDWMPAGLAVGDFNNDGWQDIFWASGGTDPDHLYINDGDGTFTDAAADWGVAVVHAACGACAGDYNDDGWLDIYVTSFGNGSNNQGQVGKNRLYRNNGNGTFTEVAAEAGVNVTGVTISSGYGCAFGDYDIDGDLDLAVTAWFASAHGNRLFRNDGDGTFTDVTGSAIDFGSTWGFQSSFADMDGDGWPELLIAADFGTSRYFRNDTNGSFTNFTIESGTGLDQNGMGQCVGDFNQDGLLDWYVTSIFTDAQQPGLGEGNKLYMNQSGHQYVETAVASGVADGGWGWGAVAVDMNNDTWPDIVEVNGRPSATEFSGEQEYVWINQGDDTFLEAALDGGMTFQAEGKACSYLDYDRDGAMDIAITFNNATNKLYRNVTLGGTWIHLSFDTQNNPLIAPNGMGAVARVRIGEKSLVGTVDSGPNFLGTSEICAHFGLGTARVIDTLTITWPRGYVTELTGVAVNQHLVIVSPTKYDLDGNGSIGASDLSLLLGAWGDLGTSGDRKADGNNDGVVNSADLAALLGAWGGR
ncbi:MAG: FG-GAP-like repeat-containing protein [Phycisphaerae bacterium]|nr:FG-GAP-like repeat-containing protein [Phycisphaerae bacterium]